MGASTATDDNSAPLPLLRDDGAVLSAWKVLIPLQGPCRLQPLEMHVFILVIYVPLDSWG